MQSGCRADTGRIPSGYGADTERIRSGALGCGLLAGWYPGLICTLPSLQSHHHALLALPRARALQVDFDVNNLMVGPSPSLALQLKYPGQGGSLGEIQSNCRAKKLLALKPATEIADRIGKMQRRGWQVRFP